MRVEGNTVQHAAGVGIYIFPAARGATSFYEQLTVSGNKVRDTSGVGLSVGLQAVNARDWNVTVTSNEILRAGDVGLSVQNADGGSVASNTVWDCVQGIVVDDCVHVAVTGNSSRTGATSSATYVGIDVKGASQWVTVAANTVRALSASQIGIRFADTASICWVGPNAVRSPTPLVEGANASSIYVTTAA
nr:right-handed parallel beta-helix repeat-containing protein [Cellulomonas sp. APG4]